MRKRIRYAKERPGLIFVMETGRRIRKHFSSRKRG